MLSCTVNIRTFIFRVAERARCAGFGTLTKPAGGDRFCVVVGACVITQPNTVPPPEAGEPKLQAVGSSAESLPRTALAAQDGASYVTWVRRFVIFHHVRHPLEMDAKEVSEFLTRPAVEARVAASKQNQALSALLFLYREMLERDFGWLETGKGKRTA